MGSHMEKFFGRGITPDPIPRLVVNADDVGLCAGVHKGTMDAVRSGTVTSISILVGPQFDVDFRPYEDAAVPAGLHLNLTLGAPCAPPRDVPSLLDQTGCLINDREAMFARLVEEEAEREIRCQLDRFRSLAGRNPSHLDTHKHFHVLDSRLFRLVSTMARELDVPLRACDAKGRDACRQMGVRTTDFFLGDVRPAPYWTEERLAEQLAQVQPGTTELMCHLGINMEKVPGLWYLEYRETETATFCSRRAKSLLSEFALTGLRDPLQRGG